MRKNIILLATAATGMAFISPFIAFLGVQGSNSITVGGAFYTWFLAVPLALYALVMPDSQLAILALSVLGYFVQHLVAFLILWASIHIARVLIRCVSDLQLALPGSARH